MNWTRSVSEHFSGDRMRFKPTLWKKHGRTFMEAVIWASHKAGLESGSKNICPPMPFLQPS